MTDNQSFQVSVGEQLCSNTSIYTVENVLGSGAYGDVAQCRKLATDETVAVKILKTRRSIEDGKEEEVILKVMKELQPEKFSIVRWNDSFTYRDRYCLEFEKLDISLHEYLLYSCDEPLRLMEIRPLLRQLATALNFLKSAGIVHADLKPENIMMVDHLEQPYKVKVIDFGIALNNPEERTGATLQTLWYRSPEVLLGCPFNEGIDVWSLGCIAAEMLMGMPLFPSGGKYDMMRHIFSIIGKPPNRMLDAGLYTEQFFSKYSAGLQQPQWRFQSPLEKRDCPCNPCTVSSLSDLNTAPHRLTGDEAGAEECDRASFHDLLARMLEVDPQERITPSEILQHPFMTMSHLVGSFDDTFYVKVSTGLMDSIEETGDGTASSSCSPCHAAPDEDDHAGPSSKDQPFHRNSVMSSGDGSTKKRHRDGVHDSESGSRSPDTTPAKKKRKACRDAAPGEKGGQTRPQQSRLHKRKRDDAEPRLTSDDNAPAKKKRSDEEASGSKEETTIPVKRKRRRRRRRGRRGVNKH